MFLTLFIKLFIKWGLFDPKKIISSEVNKLRFENIARIASNQEVTSEKNFSFQELEQALL